MTLPAHVAFHVVAADGSRFVMDEPPGPLKFGRRATSLFFVDLQEGTSSTLTTPTDGYIPFFPAISGDRVAWSEIRSVAADFGGPLDWRIRVEKLSTGETSLIASGTTTNFPILALDGDDLAYAFPDTADSSQMIITVRSATSGDVRRTLRVAGGVYRLGICNGDLAFTQGTNDPNGFIYDTHLMLLEKGSATPRQLAANAYDVSFRDGRLAWGQDSPTQVTGYPQHTRIWTAAPPDYVPEPAAPEPGLGDENVQDWPVTGGGYVSWGSERQPPAGSPGGDQLAVWDPRTRAAYLVEPSQMVIGTSTAGGWLLWVEETEPAVVKGLPLSEVPFPQR